MTTKEAVPKSTQSKRTPLTSACPTTSATRPLLLVRYRFFIGVFVGADYPIATSLITEFTPKHHRAISMGMVSAAWYLGAVAAVVGISRVGTIVATYATPIFLASFGIGPTMLVAAGLVILGLVLSIFMAPETAGKSLEETSSL